MTNLQADLIVVLLGAIAGALLLCAWLLDDIAHNLKP